MDFSFITDFFTSVNAFIQDFWNWIYLGVYDFIKEVLVVLTKAIIYAYFQSLIFAAEIGYEVVQDIFNDLGVTQQVQNAYSTIPEDMRNTLAFFRIPEALTIIFSAVPTRWAMKFIPFIGR
jgi:hypothetical protein